MPHLDPITRIKEWLTPSLITVVGIMLWSQLTELKTDVKQLLITQSGNVVKIANLEDDISELKTNYLTHEIATLREETASNRIAKKEDELSVPNP